MKKFNQNGGSWQSRQWQRSLPRKVEKTSKDSRFKIILLKIQAGAEKASIDDQDDRALKNFNSSVAS
jgi:hypothetical protein